ncbi:hypothetical protein ACS8E2_05595 [Psychrobacter glaciei]|uniref:hypothetical protein n=1 Tax=Psychrobacter glaciei TaxID=619771 RepID=UPI003F469C17
MSNMMIYATTDKVGGNIESVWGHKMRVRTIDSSNKDEVEQAKADGWLSKAGDVIEQIETQKLEAENKVMKGVLSSGDGNKRITELEEQLAEALTEVAQLEAKLAIYEESKDANGNGKVDYEEMTISELSALLKQRDVEFNARDGKAALVKLATDSE